MMVGGALDSVPIDRFGELPNSYSFQQESAKRLALSCFSYGQGSAVGLMGVSKLIANKLCLLYWLTWVGFRIP